MFISQYEKYFYFLVKKANNSKIQEICHVIYIFFGYSWGSYNCFKFYECGTCPAYFGKVDQPK